MPDNIPAQDAVDSIDIIDPFLGSDPIEDEEDQVILDQPEQKATQDEEDDLEEAPVLEEEEADEEPEPVEEEEVEEEEPAPEEEVVEEEPELEEEEEPNTSEKPDHVPIQRLDKEVARRKALQKQLDAAEKALEEKGTSLEELDLGDTATQMFDKALEGDFEAANSALKEILTSVIQTTQNSVLDTVDSRINSHTAKNAVQQTVDEVIIDLQETYPQLNAESDQFDESLTRRTLGLQKMYIEEGLDSATALEQGAQDAIQQLRPELIQVEQAAEEEPAPSRKEEVATQRRTEAVRKKAAAAVKQPPKTTGTRDEVETASIEEMSDAEFEALSEADLKKMRGDIL